MNDLQVVQILLPLPFNEAFDYQCPADQPLKPGSFVRVPFGPRKVIGVVWSSNIPSTKPEKIKPIEQVLSFPPLKENLRELVEWVADYTLSPKGQVLKMAMSVPEALEEEPPAIGYRFAEPFPDLRITASRQRVIDVLSQKDAQTMSCITKQAHVSNAVVHGMVKTGMLVSEVLPSQGAEPVKLNESILPNFSENQQQAADQLSTFVREEGFNATLLDGVTGSGKTEVYFAAIETALKESKGQVLILLPEIVLTTQLLNRFSSRFGFLPYLWHSSLSKRQRIKTWRQVIKGEARLVIGARSALFLPFKDLKLIVVDEEHESSFKQEEGVMYHGRDMAVMRAFKERISIILASATPSLETMHNVEIGKFARVHLTERHAGATMPEIQVIDMRQEKLDAKHWLSVPLQQALKKTLDAGKQAMLYLNRRGYAPLTLCRTCGHRFQCHSCSSWLVHHTHRSRQQLHCHHCGFMMPLPETCPECGDKDSFAACGPGVERVCEEVREMFPQARQAVMTSDTVKNPKDAKHIIDSIMQGDADIIIGTQMIAKGHHFPKLDLVGIIDADLGLAGGDLRASERTYQLLHQVAGRAGREGSSGKAILQSYMPENTVLAALTSANRDAFMGCEAQIREMHALPPYGKLAGIIVSGPDQMQVLQAAKNLAQHAPYHEDQYQILGPAPAPLALLRGKYRQRLLVKAKRNVNIQRMVESWLAGVQIPNKVRVKVDIDPYNFM